jgi:hypothetical protein
MDSRRDTLAGGLPHSEIPGSTIARISPGLIAACHALHRLSVPRHPPDALTLLDYAAIASAITAAQQNPPLTGTSPTSDVNVKTLFTSKTDTTRRTGKHTGPATAPVSVTLSLHPVKEPANGPKDTGKLVFHRSCAAAGGSEPGTTLPSRRNKSYGCRAP